MTTFLYAAALFVLINLAGSLLRVLKGPTPADKMMGAQLIGTGGVTILILLFLIEDNESILDVALLLALLAAFAAIGFVKSLTPAGTGDPEAGV